MNASDFEAAGKRLFGRHGWRAELAEALGVHRSTIWHYEKGKRPVPESVALALEALEQRRIAT